VPGSGADRFGRSAGGGLHPGRALRDLAGQYGKAGEAGCGANVLAGADALRMIERTKLMMKRKNGWKNPFGDGRAGESIVEHLRAA